MSDREFFEETIRLLQDRIQEMNESHDRTEAVLRRTMQKNEYLTRQNNELSRQAWQLSQEVARLSRTVHDIHNSKTWRIGQLYGRILGVSSALRIRVLSRIRRVQGEVSDHGPAGNTAEEKSDKEPPGVVRGSTYDILFYPMINFSFRYQRPQQLASYFAKRGHRVFYLNMSEFLPPEGSQEFALREIRSNLYEVCLRSPAPPDVYGAAMDDGILYHLHDSLSCLRRQLGLWTVIGVVHNPFWVPLALKMRQGYQWKVLYDCMDDWDGDIFRGIKEPIVAEERVLVREADLVTVTADLLFQKFTPRNRTCTVVRNAADYEHFMTAAPNALLKDVRKPILGFFGGIAEWIDIEAIRYVATERKDLSFVFLGGIFTDVSSIEKLPNVHLLGNQPYERMPAYLHNFDVCLLPVRRTKITEAMDHVKVYEYMTSGKPIVARAIHEVKQYGDVVYLYDDNEGFLHCIERALHENDPRLPQKRRSLARANTWDHRVTVMEGKIGGLYRKASLIVVTFNNVEFTRLCLESIIGRTDYPNYEVIVIDNASTDGTREYLMDMVKRHEFISVTFNEKNEGFAKANNAGIRTARGDYIVLLNNDTIVTRGWLTKFVQYLERHPDIGLIGPVTNGCFNEARIDVPYAGVEGTDEFAHARSLSHEGRLFDIRMLALYCAAMRREVIDDVGLLDEVFGVGMFEDDDFSHRVKLRGYRVMCAEDIFIHHFGMASFRELQVAGEYLDLFEKNKAIFEDKWGIPWEPVGRG